MKQYFLKNVHMSGNEHGELKKDVIYADLVDKEGNLIISATLEYILATIRERDYNVKGVTVHNKLCRGAVCSTIVLTKYDSNIKEM